ERAVAVFERNQRARETAVRVDIAMLAHKLAIRGLGLTETAARKELRGGVARETVVVRNLGLDRATLPCERLRELARLLVVHHLPAARRARSASGTTWVRSTLFAFTPI